MSLLASLTGLFFTLYCCCGGRLIALAVSVAAGGVALCPWFENAS